MGPTFWIWFAFAVFIVGLLALDLAVVHRKVRAIGVREAGFLCAFYLSLAALFFLGVVYFRSLRSGVEFLTGYCVEVALSFDNLFVFLLIFVHFKVPLHLQHRVLFWGILGAIAVRGVLIVTGAVLAAEFRWVLYGLGALLVYSGFKMMWSGETDEDFERGRIICLLRKRLRLVDEYHGEHFFIRREGKIWATPLLLVLVLVNLLDVALAIDSIPAILSVTRDPFVLVTSNAFAILGLRALFFLLVGMAVRFRYLRHGLAAMLILIGGKSLLEDTYHLPIWFVLLATIGMVGASVVVSLLLPRSRVSSRESAKQQPSR